MSNFFTSVALMLAAFTSQSALACPGSTLKIHDLSLSPDGVITRTITVKKQSDAQSSNSRNEKYVTKVRDVVTLERGDEIVMNAGLQMVDASLFVKMKLKSQDRDEKGIFSTTYEIVETQTSSFFGIEQVAQVAYLAKIIGSYAGNGERSRACGEVIKTKLDILEAN